MDLGETNFALFDKTKKERTFKKISLPMTITVYFYFNQEWMTSKKERKTTKDKLILKRLSLNSAEWTRWLNSKKLNKKEERKEKKK